MDPLPTSPRLHAGELELRLPEDGDAETIAALCQDPAIARWTRVPSPYSVADAEQFVTWARGQAKAGTSFNLVVVDAAEVVATCGLVDIDGADLVAEVGYWVGATARGRGVATTAAREVCRWAFEDLGLERLHLQAATDNAASNAVARRIGFQLEGVSRQGSIPGHTGEPGTPRVDMNRYGLLPLELTA